MESQCVVPFTSFAEPDPKSKKEGEPVLNAWFALSEDRPVFFFAGVWTSWRGVRRVRNGKQDFELYGFLTCPPNSAVAPIHEKALPVILTEPNEIETRLTVPWEEAKALQRPLPDDKMMIVDAPAVPAEGPAQGSLFRTSTG